MSVHVLSAAPTQLMASPVLKSVAIIVVFGIAGIFNISQHTCLHSTTVSMKPAVLVLVDRVLCLYALSCQEVWSIVRSVEMMVTDM